MHQARRVPRHSRRRAFGVTAAAVAALLVLPGGAAATQRPDDGDRGTGGASDASRRRSASTWSRSATTSATWRDIHTTDAISIFASGTLIEGRDAIVAALASHFDNREAVWSWTETSRRVDGCRTAYILYDTVYAIRRLGFRQHARTGVTYTYESGRWLVVADQGTPLP